MRKILHLICVLTLIAGICAALLAGVYALTAPLIEANRALRANTAAREVLPASVQALTPCPQDPTIQLGWSNATCTELAGYALTGECGAGYGGKIVLMVGFTKDLEVVSYQVLQANETPGLGAKLSEAPFIAQFNGKKGNSLKVKKDGGAIEALTGATITSRAVCAAIAHAHARLVQWQTGKNAPSVTSTQDTSRAEGTLRFKMSQVLARVLPAKFDQIKKYSNSMDRRFPLVEACTATGDVCGYAVVGTGRAEGPHGAIILHILFGFTASKALALKPQIVLNEPSVPMTDMEHALRTAQQNAQRDALEKLKRHNP